MDGWIVILRPRFSTVLQLFQDSWKVIMKRYVHVWKKSHLNAQGIVHGTARSAGQRLTFWATGVNVKCNLQKRQQQTGLSKNGAKRDIRKTSPIQG